MRKVLWLLLLTLLFNLFGCSSERKSTAEPLESKIENSPQTITILFPQYEIYTEYPATLDYYYNFLNRIKTKFEGESNITVNIEKVSGDIYADYAAKRDQILSNSTAPELTFIHPWNSSVELVNKNLAVKIDDNISNLKNLYSGLTDGYFVPIGIYNGNLTIKRSAIDKYNINEPGYEWNSKDYFEIRDKWLEKESIRFNSDEYWNNVKLTWNDIDIFDEKTNKVELNKADVVSYIKMLRNDLYYGKYILNDEYTAENYNKMFNDLRSDESRKNIAIFKEELNKHFLGSPYENRKNLLNSLNTNSIFANNDILVLPDIVEYGKVQGWGFVVNKNGANSEAGMKFINYLLSDEIQLEIFKQGAESTGMAPVSKSIEEAVSKIEKESNILAKAIDTREYILDCIEEGQYKLTNISNDDEPLKIQFAKNIVTILFSNKDYTDEEIANELEELENKLQQFADKQ